jgi:DNA-directed RNA polymerase specialized sigma24 family protein
MRPADPDDDAALLRRCAAGDDEAFAVFYRRHLDGVLAFLRRRVREPELAFDLAAETFAAAITGAGTWRGEGEAAAWLYGIARNKLLASLRSGRVEDAARLAAELACSEQVVRQRVHRGLRALRTEMGEA